MAMAVWSAQVGNKTIGHHFPDPHAAPRRHVFWASKSSSTSRNSTTTSSPATISIWPIARLIPLPPDDPQAIAAEKEELEKALRQDPDINAHAQLYFSLYFGMTGLHALHMIVGAGLLLWLIKNSIAGRFHPQYNTPVEVVGLYWHFVDIVWIYLVPVVVSDRPAPLVEWESFACLNTSFHRKFTWPSSLSLMVGTGLTVWAAFQNFGAFNIVIALGIASVKATLVVLYFMHARYSPKRTQLVIVCSVFWLALMLALTLTDYSTRSIKQGRLAPPGAQQDFRA